MGEMELPTVREALPGDEAAWRRLWAGYTSWYKAHVPDDVTAATWARILDPGSAIFCRVAESDGHVVGFAVCILHAGSWVVDPICYLEDLFVDPGARGVGVGSALVQDLIDLGRSRGWARLYWHTQTGNEAARRIYDRFTAVDDCVRYQLVLT